MRDGSRFAYFPTAYGQRHSAGHGQIKYSSEVSGNDSESAARTREDT